VELSDLKARFGKVVQRRRLALRVGQEDFADKVGIHRTTLSLLERGKHVPNLDMVRRLAAAFGVKMSVLVAEAEDEVAPLAEPSALPKGRPKSTKPKSGSQG